MKRSPLLHIAIGLAFVVIATQNASPTRPSRSTQWLDRPWEIRYLLFVGNARLMATGRKVAHQRNDEAETIGKEKVYRHGDALFDPATTFTIKDSEPLAVFLLAFNRDGRVKVPANLSRLTAKRNMLNDLVLIEDVLPTAKPYLIADWSQGVPGNVSFSPAVCGRYDFDRYDDDWNKDNYIGNFGCREWTAQLYRRDQLYINVTTYSSDGNFIGEFVGWSRFTDPAKPVIGQHGKTWLCLHECPAGEKPGVIANIKAWTAKHGYPMPKRPPSQPEYPNKNYDFND